MTQLTGGQDKSSTHAVSESYHEVGVAREEVVVPRGRTFIRRFTRAGVHPYEEITWETRRCEIRGGGGEIIFSQNDVEVPEFWSQMAATIVASKYLHGENGAPNREYSIKQLIDRVVSSLCMWGKHDGYFLDTESLEAFRSELTYVLVNQRAAFNSPVWFNMGVDKHPQCSACFILSLEDNMESLLELQRVEGILFRSGSGCGTNLSSIRSSKEKLSSGGVPSGPLSFMRGYDAWAGSIKSGGKTRRAAKMQILNVSHPDIIDFISCKAIEEKKAWALIEAGYDGGFNVPGGAYDSVSFQNANLSIRVSDEFMRAVIEDGTFETRAVTDGHVCERLRAREVLMRAAQCAHVCGDPGIQFDTIINQWHTCPNSGRINASNPCSEYMHLDDSACNLASINLLSFLGHDGAFAVEDFKHVVDLLVTAQDILIDHSRYPTKRVTRNAHDYRQVGIGFANLGAVLMSLGLPYDSQEGREWASCLSSLLTAQAYLTSANVAHALQPFRGFRRNRAPMLNVVTQHAEEWDKRQFKILPTALVEEVRLVWREARKRGEEWGFRNSQTTAIAPTGTIGFMMDCDTTGIEPDLALVKYKKLCDGGMLKIVNGSVARGLRTLGYESAAINEIVAYIEKHDTIEGAPHLAPEHVAVFDCAFTPRNGTRSISYRGHLHMMAAVQPFISGAISKTVNVPNQTTVEEIFDIYVEAWKLGLKSIALYRDGSKRTQPLTTSAAQGKAEVQLLPIRRKLPDERRAFTHKFSVGGLEGYLTVGLFEDGQPGEIFLVVAKEGSTLSGIMDAFATAVSISLQYGVPLATLVRKFTYTRFEPSGFTTNKEIPIAQSIIDYVFRWLALKFLSVSERAELGIRTQTVGAAEATESVQSLSPKALVAEGQSLPFHPQEDAPPCIRCGSSLMVRQAGCYYCLNCGSQGGCG